MKFIETTNKYCGKCEGCNPKTQYLPTVRHSRKPIILIPIFTIWSGKNVMKMSRVIYVQEIVSHKLFILSSCSCQKKETVQDSIRPENVI